MNKEFMSANSCCTVSVICPMHNRSEEATSPRNAAGAAGSYPEGNRIKHPQGNSFRNRQKLVCKAAKRPDDRLNGLIGTVKEHLYHFIDGIRHLLELILPGSNNFGRFNMQMAHV